MDNHRLGHATMAAPDRSDSIIRRLEVHDLIFIVGKDVV
jgi:hypothetical protein